MNAGLKSFGIDSPCFASAESTTSYFPWKAAAIDKFYARKIRGTVTDLPEYSLVRKYSGKFLR